MNGVYLQLHAYMLRIAIPYGTLVLAPDAQARPHRPHLRPRLRPLHHAPEPAVQLAELCDIPDILDELAEVEMHAIQTSGNCIRNVTADHFAGAAADEVADPRPYAEILRQWSSLHPEFSFLPRKFKIAVTGAEHDRAAIQVHDIGLHLKRDADGGLGFAVYVGGGLGRTPMIAKKIRDVLPEERPALLPGGDPARLQSARPARQQVQGAHQDPGPRDRRRGVRRARSRRSGSASATAR